jgi:hypothetical protein
VACRFENKYALCKILLTWAVRESLNPPEIEKLIYAHRCSYLAFAFMKKFKLHKVNNCSDF